MKITSLHFKIALTLGTVLLTTSVTFAAPFAAGKSTQQFVPGEVLVKFKPAVSAQARTSAVTALGGSVRTSLNHDLLHVQLGVGQSVEATVAAYSNDANVEYAQPNYIYHAAAVPNDPGYGQQWAFKNVAQTITPIAPAVSAPYATNNPGTTGSDMNMVLAWDHITDCSSVVVAVIDSGVNYKHQDLAANMWNGGVAYPNHGANFTTEGAANDPMDLNGHGTHVAGIIGAVGNNGLETTGVCWKANIMAVRALDSTGTGTTSTIITGINYAVTNGAKVINMSLAGGGAFDSAYSAAVTNAQSHDVVVVVGAGNDNLNNDAAGHAVYPCNFTQPNLICVAALDQSDALASFSNTGATSVDVGAPGTNVLSTWAGNTVTTKYSLNPASPLALVWKVPTGNGFFGYGVASPGVSPYTAGSSYYSINNPAVSSWPSGYAAASSDARAWANFNLAGLNAATLDVFGAAHVVSDGGKGSFAIAYSAAGGDPFAAAAPTYFAGAAPAATDATPAVTPVFSAYPTLSLANCLTAACTIGFQLKTGPTITNLGMSLVGPVTVTTLALNFTTYKLDSGTSMATPAVAGLATMLRAYNPQYTYADVVSAIKNGGRAVASLAGKTTTGKAVDAMKSLAYINTPTGLTATVQ